MAHILLNENTRAIVQWVTGKVGQAQTRWMLEARTPIVAGVTPGKGGQRFEGLPVYDTVAEALAHEGANASVIFVPAAFARQADGRRGNARSDEQLKRPSHAPSPRSPGAFRYHCERRALTGIPGSVVGLMLEAAGSPDCDSLVPRA